MAVKIRLKKMGTKKKPHFYIVICDQRGGRDARTIEEVGYYDPSKNPPLIKVNKERVDYWLGVGAEISDTVRSIIKKK